MAPPQGKIHYMREILYLLETILKRETKIILAIFCLIKGKKTQVCPSIYIFSFHLGYKEIILKYL